MNLMLDKTAKRKAELANTIIKEIEELLNNKTISIIDCLSKR